MMQWILGTAAILILLAGCGKGQPPPSLPMPAPVPQTTPGQIGGGGFSPVGNCGGGAGQYPVSQTPFYGNLTSQYGGFSSGNSIQLTLSTQGFGGLSSVISVYGSALLNLPDLANVYPQQPGYQQQVPYQFCVSSQPATGGQPFPGVYSPSDRSIAITMYGVAQVPVYTYPYIPGASQFTQQPVTVTIGSQCGAWIYEGRVYGCVLVQLGNGQQVLYYNAQ